MAIWAMITILSLMLKDYPRTNNIHCEVFSIFCTTFSSQCSAHYLLYIVECFVPSWSRQGQFCAKALFEQSPGADNDLCTLLMHCTIHIYTLLMHCTIHIYTLLLHCTIHIYTPLMHCTIHIYNILMHCKIHIYPLLMHCTHGLY